MCHVRWLTETGHYKAKLSDILVAQDLSISLLSIPALAKMNIAKLFMIGKPHFMDLEDNVKTLAQGLQDAEGLFYIFDQQGGSLVALKQT